MNKFKDLFTDLQDPRVEGRCKHKLTDIVFIALCTIVCNGEDFEDMEEFGQQRIDWLKTILELPNGIPSHDTFNRVLQKLEPTVLSQVLELDGKQFLDTVIEKQICIDGKKLRGVSPTSKGNSGLYVLNAWVSENNICIGQEVVGDKSNEITVIPDLLNSLDISGSIVSIDAIGCQKKIAEKILDKDADYLLALKKNQKDTFEMVEDIFRFNQATDEDIISENKNHGRIEKRKCSIINLESIPQDEIPKNWTGLKTVIKIEASRVIKKEIQNSTRYYISSENYSYANYFNLLVRGHWSVENQLHWQLDVTFREDDSRARAGYSQLNLNILRKIALMRISKMNDKLSKKKRRFRASLNNDYLISVLDI